MIVIDNSMLNNKSYRGYTKRLGITLNSRDYKLKSPDFSLKVYRNGKPIYYDSSIYSEYIASNFIKNLGVPCQNTLLCRYKSHDCVLMEDFTQDVEGLTLCTYNDLGVKNQPYTFDEILSVLATDTKLSIVEREKTIRQFWSMFLCDAILGNSDRHQSNWGF